MTKNEKLIKEVDGYFRNVANKCEITMCDECEMINNKTCQRIYIVRKLLINENPKPGQTLWPGLLE